MSSQFALFAKRRFYSMFATQFFGSFNDNIFRQALILVLTFSAAAKMDVDVSVLNNLAALLFILPFFLFSALAGQIADKYEKSKLTRMIKLLECLIMILATAGFMLEIYWLLFVALFLMGTQSSFFGPIKYAYLPQAMHQDELVGANALFQTGTSLSILFGMIVAGYLVQMSNSTYWTCAILLSIAVIGYITARQIPTTPAMQPSLKINWNIVSTSWSTIRYLRSLPLLFFVILGNSWFWFYGATFLTQIPQFSKDILHGNQSVVIFMLMLFSIGVSIGSLLCKKLSKNSISLHLLPYGIAGLSIFAVDMYFSLSGHSANASTLLDISGVLQNPANYRVFTDLFFLGFSGGLYIVPLYAYMQAYAPESHRARIVGANNIFNALFMVISAIFAIITLTKLDFSLPQLFMITGIINLGFGIFIYYKLKKYANSMSLQTHE